MHLRVESKVLYLLMGSRFRLLVGHLLCLSMVLFPTIAVGTCIALREVDIDDDGLLSAAQRKALVQRFVGQCLDQALLRALLHALAAEYSSQGYITTRPYLQPQDASDGKVRVSVLRGTVEAVVDAASGHSNRRLRNLFAGQQGQPLNLRRLETSLEWINRLQSVDARFELRPGKRAGGTVVAVRTTESRPWRLTFGGIFWPTDSQRAIIAEATWDNPLDLNDILEFHLNTSQVRRYLQGGRGGGFVYSLPLSGLLASLYLSRSSYRQRLSVADVTFSGRSDLIALKLDKVLIRDKRHKLDIGVAMRHQRIRNNIAGVPLEVSSYRTSQASIELTGLQIWPWGSLMANYAFSHGTPWFGARTDEDPLSSPELRHMFRRHELELKFSARLQPRLELTSLLHAQYSPDALYNNDRLVVGSDVTVRGYLYRNLLGDTAWYTRNDLRLHWRADALQWGLGPGLDYGRAQCHATNRSTCGVVAGLSLNASAAYGGVQLAASWSHPLRRLPDGHRPDDVVRLDLIWTF